ncbi:hypothetical protein F5884DRAFT_509641 [Xylogone sp. PMI_703]|nr:hypothetical protein F5884DRAFT_509641 [Xylogone sp. PMI_703]
MVALTWAVALLPGLWVTCSASQFFSQIQPCPDVCSDLGSNPSNWTYLHDTQKFDSCNETIIFDLNLYNNIADPKTHTTIRSCTVDSSFGSSSTRSAVSCGNFTATNASVEVAWSGESVALSQGLLSEVFSPLKSQLVNSQSTCGSKIIFSKLNNVIVGVYAGSNVASPNSIDGLLQQLNNQAMTNGLGDTTVIQHCGKGINSNYTMGIVVSTNGDLGSAQAALQSWSNATCVNGLTKSSGSSPITLFTKSLSVKRSRMAIRDSTCSTVKVVSGDSCGSLATECGISPQDFTTFNPNPSLCSTLAVGQSVCCSVGSLPDLTPQQGADGSCAAYTVQAGDFCALIAASNGITTDDIENFNKDTWGWQGCSNVLLGQIICLSSGIPPFPAPVSNTICGPQVPGTQPSSDVSSWPDLNPCPLNSCCDIWGQCGITPDFCTINESPSGAPGTAAAGTNGCISNCGTSIVNNNQAPANFIKVGYWEAFDVSRPCLQMSVSQIPSGYSHIHFAFAGVTSDFQVDTSGVTEQFQDFVKATGYKKIISFGGWSFSTDTDSFPIFREGVTTANRQTFAQSVVNMITENNLDGVDFDWEYPGAPDIPGIPPGSPSDGPNYLAFLQTLRSMLPAGKTMSMAAPASYWYLRGFPIKDMAPVLDYIVFMTYDLHGQWDYNNAFTNPGCPTGNCLRSHINSTETEFALAMITKAGVPSNKVVVGVSSYGRSFGMTTPGCIGVTCLFDGPDSDALPGPCTQTPGYIADAEIQTLINEGGVQLRDEDSDSDIVIFANTWVAYMSPTTKSNRISQYKGLNFAGTVDWAIDLETGDVNGTFSGSGGDQDNPSPTNASIIPLTCTSLAPGATFTLTADCAAEIAGLPPLTSNNQPPGPSNCSENCNLLREITATCCGTGGSIGNPVVVIPGVQLPLNLPLPSGYEPPNNLTIGPLTLQPNQPAPVSFQLPAGFDPTEPFTIPGGQFPPDVPLAVPVILPPGFVPHDPFTVGSTIFPANVPLAAAVPLPASFVPPGPDPFVVPPFTAIPGAPLPGPVVIPAGFTPSEPFTIPPIVFPPGVPVPPNTVIPPAAVVPAPIIFPAGTPLAPDSIVPVVPPAEEEDQPDFTDPPLAAVVDFPAPEVPDPTDSASGSSSSDCPPNTSCTSPNDDQSGTSSNDDTSGTTPNDPNQGEAPVSGSGSQPVSNPGEQPVSSGGSG